MYMYVQFALTEPDARAHFGSAMLASVNVDLDQSI